MAFVRIDGRNIPGTRLSPTETLNLKRQENLSAAARSASPTTAKLIPFASNYLDVPSHDQDLWLLSEAGGTNASPAHRQAQAACRVNPTSTLPRHTYPTTALEPHGQGKAVCSSPIIVNVTNPSRHSRVASCSSVHSRNSPVPPPLPPSSAIFKL